MSLDRMEERKTSLEELVREAVAAQSAQGKEGE